MNRKVENMAYIGAFVIVAGLAACVATKHSAAAEGLPSARQIKEVHTKWTGKLDSSKTLTVTDAKAFTQPVMNKLDDNKQYLQYLAYLIKKADANGADTKDLKLGIVNLTSLTMSQGNVIINLQKKLRDTVTTMAAKQRISDARATQAEQNAADERAKKAFEDKQSKIGKLIFSWLPVAIGFLLVLWYHLKEKKSPLLHSTQNV